MIEALREYHRRRLMRFPPYWAMYYALRTAYTVLRMSIYNAKG